MFSLEREAMSEASLMLPKYKWGNTWVAGWFSMSLVSHKSDGDGRSGRNLEDGEGVEAEV